MLHLKWLDVVGLSLRRKPRGFAPTSLHLRKFLRQHLPRFTPRRQIVIADANGYAVIIPVTSTAATEACMKTPDQRSHSARVTRRNFNVVAGAMSVSAIAGPSLAGSRLTSSEPIRLGVIGLGSRGFNLLDDFLRQPDCRIVALCDVDEFHHRDQPWGKGKTFGRKPAEQHVRKAYDAGKNDTVADSVRLYSDYRKLIAQDDINAVVVATPDHWHALCTWEALQAGKDVYCEKPITHLFAEGQAIVAEVARQNAVFQTGSQQRSDPKFQRLVEIVQNGLLGDVQTVEVGLPPGYTKPMGSTEVVTPREGLDYDFWCGPSERLPLMQARHHRWWRGHRAFGGGVLMDWIGHHNDCLLYTSPSPRD